MGSNGPWIEDSLLPMDEYLVFGFVGIGLVQSFKCEVSRLRGFFRVSFNYYLLPRNLLTQLFLNHSKFYVQFSQKPTDLNK